jgi:hypothetical protein
MNGCVRVLCACMLWLAVLCNGQILPLEGDPEAQQQPMMIGDWTVSGTVALWYQVLGVICSAFVVIFALAAFALLFRQNSRRRRGTSTALAKAASLNKIEEDL